MFSDVILQAQVRTELELRGITRESVTQDDLDSLHQHLKKHLEESDAFNGTFRIDGDKGSYGMTCSCEQWSGREAVTFNMSGFIGFAGWSSTRNIQPILAAVLEWASAKPYLKQA